MKIPFLFVVTVFFAVLIGFLVGYLVSFYEWCPALNPTAGHLVVFP